MKAFVYWSYEFKVWEVWFSDTTLPSEYFHCKREAVEYAKKDGKRS